MNDEHPPTLIFGPLEKGQNWLMKDESLRVKHVGKYLVECTITKRPVKPSVKLHYRSFKQFLSIKDVLIFLQAHKAVLAHVEQAMEAGATASSFPLGGLGPVYKSCAGARISPKMYELNNQPTQLLLKGMEQIHQLLNRIHWDKEFGQGKFELGYFDRHESSIQRVALNQIVFPEAERRVFNCMDEDGVLHHIPFHRIREVYKNGQLIWKRQS